MAWNLYDIFRDRQIGGDANSIDLTAVTVKCALVAAGYTVDQNLHDFFADVTNEVSGTGYTAGGNTVASITSVLSVAGLVTVDGNDPATWLQNAGGFSNAARAVLYRDTGVAATSELIAYSDTFTVGGNVAGDFSVQLDAAGIFTSAR